jgi:Tfp pilus assembly protein PilF
LSLSDINKYNQAIQYDKALALNPTATDILNNKGMALLYLEKYDESLKILKSIYIQL